MRFGEDRRFGARCFGEDRRFGDDRCFGARRFGEDSLVEESCGDGGFGDDSFGEDSVGFKRRGDGSPFGCGPFAHRDRLGEGSFGEGLCFGKEQAAPLLEAPCEPRQAAGLALREPALPLG